jgi:hypothetical protein
MPPWANGARIVFDTEYNLAFIRKERRGAWAPYTVRGAALRPLGGVDDRRKLNDVREAILRAVGDSIMEMVQALHPGAPFRHMIVHGNQHLCGAPYRFESAYAPKDVTCPLCLAVMAEDLAIQTGKAGPKTVEAAREHVKVTRAVNALGSIVTGEDATDRL